MTINPLFKLATAALALSAAPALAGHDGPRQPAERDCKPYNGTHGYYGNPWCEGWNEEGAGHTLSFEWGPDGYVKTERGYRRPVKRDLRR